MFRIQGAYISIDRIEYFNWLKSEIKNLRLTGRTGNESDVGDNDVGDNSIGSGSFAQTENASTRFYFEIKRKVMALIFEIIIL